MGREMRMVPETWVHPTNELGHPIPLHASEDYARDLRYYRIARAAWDSEEGGEYEAEHGAYMFDGMMDHKRNGGAFECKPPPGPNGWTNPEPRREDYMPDWPAGERTHCQMYETCTEGTPISPVCESPEELARWLAGNEASAFGDMTATYEEWLATCRSGAVSAAIIGGEMVSGVELEGRREQEDDR